MYDRAYTSAYDAWVDTCAFGGVTGIVTAAETEVVGVDGDARAGIDVVLQEPAAAVVTAAVTVEAVEEHKVGVGGIGQWQSR